jgi:hypothetical protein
MHQKMLLRAVYTCCIPVFAMANLAGAAVMFTLGHNFAAIPLMVSGLGFLTQLPAMVIWLSQPSEVATVSKHIGSRATAAIIEQARRILRRR